MRACGAPPSVRRFDTIVRNSLVSGSSAVGRNCENARDWCKRSRSSGTSSARCATRGGGSVSCGADGIFTASFGGSLAPACPPGSEATFLALSLLGATGVSGVISVCTCLYGVSEDPKATRNSSTLPIVSQALVRVVNLPLAHSRIIPNGDRKTRISKMTEFFRYQGSGCGISGSLSGD